MTMAPDDLQFIPIRQFSERLREGWAMLPGFPLQAGDYAVLMVPPPVTLPVKSNKGRGRLSAYATTLRKEAVRLSARLEAAE